MFNSQCLFASEAGFIGSRTAGPFRPEFSQDLLLRHNAACRQRKSLAFWPQPRSSQAVQAGSVALDSLESSLQASGQVPKIQWYPGHIAKAERRLKEQLSLVDVVLEVRDARIPAATCHPSIPEWCGTKPRVLVMNRVDMISDADQKAWNAHFTKLKQRVFWTNGVTGTGIHQVAKAATEISGQINAKRKARGLKGRPVRACVIGFPNIGKSALINRLLKKRACESAPKPGVTRNLKWVRVGGELDLLDAPGVIPMAIGNQQTAQLLAICNDIGEASYLESQVAVALLDGLRRLPDRERIIPSVAERWKVPWTSEMTSEDFLHAFAAESYQSDIEQTAIKILNDFRGGLLGSICLERPR